RPSQPGPPGRVPEAAAARGHAGHHGAPVAHRSWPRAAPRDGPHPRGAAVAHRTNAAPHQLRPTNSARGLGAPRAESVVRHAALVRVSREVIE
ncbi:hypothetical protein, partial [Streptomyces olivaceus]